MKSLIYILTVLTLLLLNSCQKFIDLQPLDRISTNDYWKTSTDLKNYMLQFYPSVFSGTQMVVENAGSSDDMISETVNTVMNGERALTTGNWRGDWSPIRNINIFFDNYKRCESPFESYKHYLGEAYFFRAWYYFGLVRRYGDVPWYSKVVQLES